MIQVRMSVFETNSSSTHSLCVLNKEDYDKWYNGLGKVNIGNKTDNFVLNEDIVEGDKDYYYYKTHDEMTEDADYIEISGDPAK